MITNKKSFGFGAIMMVMFMAVLFIMFMPIFDGKNGLEYLDDLYNSISKGSAYYIPKVKEEIAPLAGQRVSMDIGAENPRQAQTLAELFMRSGAMVNVFGNELKVSGDIGAILSNALADADAMYHNDSRMLRDKYGFAPKVVLYNWWTAVKEMDRSLKKQKQFKTAKLVSLVNKKAIETSYNYYGIQAEHIGDKIGIVLFSLLFYVLYTLWYGFGIMYMFEGWGLRIGH